jgi:hypothetical protein
MNFRKSTLGASFKGTDSERDGQLLDETGSESVFAGIFGSEENKGLEMSGQRKTLARNTDLPFPAVAGTQGNNSQRINVKRDDANPCGTKFLVTHYRSDT